MILAEFLDSPSNRPVLRSKTLIKVDIVALLDMKPDHRRVRNYRIPVPDVRQLSSWRSEKPCCVCPKGQARYPQQRGRLGHERAWVWEAPSGSEGVEGNHTASYRCSRRHDLC